MTLKSPVSVLKQGLRIGAVVLLSGLGMLLLATPALAYGPVLGNSSAAVNPTSGGPGQQVTFTATFRDQFNNAVSPAMVVTFFQVSGPAGCTVTFAQGSATTDANGQVSVVVTMPQGCSGQFVLGATAGGVTVSAAVSETGGFANTSALPQAVLAGGLSSTWSAGIIAVGLLLLVVGVLAFRFRRPTRAEKDVAGEPAAPTREPVGTRRNP
jgi:hypothetical protein